jgi:hypothetical protein
MSPRGSDHRPAPILIAVSTMFLTGICLLATAIGLVLMRGDLKEGIERGLREDSSFSDAAGMAGLNAAVLTFYLMATAAIYLLSGVFQLLLAPMIYKGISAARVLGLVLAGVSLGFCGIGGIASRAMVVNFSHLGERYDEQLSGALLRAVPTWLASLQWLSLLLLIAGSMLVIILLAVPASKEHFVRRSRAYSPYLDG